VTAPGAPRPNGAFTLGGRYGQDITEASARSVMKAGSVGSSGSYTNVQSSVNSQVKTPIVQTQAVAVTTGVIGGQTVTRYLYLSGGTWTKPTPPAGKRISRIGACAICGGNGGNGPSGVNGDGSEGGEGGGYLYKEFVASAVPNSVTVTIGAGGLGGGQNAFGQVGGVSSFGGLVVGIPSTSNVQTSQGALGATCAPGRGGTGGGGGEGDSYSYKSPGYRGQSTALGIGGNGGAAYTSGSAGGATGTDPHIFSGGAGGGGGGGSAGSSGSIGAPLRPGGGGAGVAPGGGGGGAGGGQRGGLGVGAFLPGGAGASGGVCVWVYYEDITTT
jgi:hypothetical protein